MERTGLFWSPNRRQNPNVDFLCLFVCLFVFGPSNRLTKICYLSRRGEIVPPISSTYYASLKKCHHWENEDDRGNLWCQLFCICLKALWCLLKVLKVRWIQKTTNIGHENGDYNNLNSRLLITNDWAVMPVSIYNRLSRSDSCWPITATATNRGWRSELG